MNKETFSGIESYMLSCMNDGAHDEHHIYRVLYYALDIAECYEVDIDVVIASALLHDIGRDAQFRNPSLDHSAVGAEMAYDFIVSSGWSEDKASRIQRSISTHRYRKNNEPDSIEAKILFDADKLDVTGAVGIARTLAYKGIVAEPLYTVDRDGRVLDGTRDDVPSFFQEYNFKLKNIYDGFYTEKAREIACGRKEAAMRFYESMLEEVVSTYQKGNLKLKNVIWI